MALVFAADMKTPTRNSIMLAIADAASDDGSQSYQSRESIAKKANVSTRTVQRTCAELIDDGLIIEAGKRACRGGYTINYTVNLDALLGANPCHTVTPDTVSPVTTTPVTPDTVSPEPLNHPKLKDIPRGISKKPPRKPPKRKSQIRQDWMPDDLQPKTLAKITNLTTEEQDDELDKFRDYHTAKQTLSGDWNANWRTWISQTAKWKRERPRPAIGNQSSAANLAQAFDDVDAGIFSTGG